MDEKEVDEKEADEVNDDRLERAARGSEFEIGEYR